MSGGRKKGAAQRYAGAGNAMLEALKKSAWLPAYDTEGRRKALAEMQELHDNIVETIAAMGGDIKDPTIAGAVVVHHNAALRNKRLLGAYHRHRMDVIEDMRWDKGAVLSPYHSKKLDTAEELYFKEYSTLLADYMNAADLSDCLGKLEPPKYDKREIAVVTAVGSITAETAAGSGRANYELNANTRHVMEMSEAQMIIRRGHLRRTKRKL